MVLIYTLYIKQIIKAYFIAKGALNNTCNDLYGDRIQKRGYIQIHFAKLETIIYPIKIDLKNNKYTHER